MAVPSRVDGDDDRLCRDSRSRRAAVCRFPGPLLARARSRARVPQGVRRRVVRRRLPGGADPRAVRRLRARHRRRERRARGDPQERLQRRRVPRADVHDGHAAEARQRGAEARVSAVDRRGHVAAAGVRRHGADERHGHDADSHDGRARRRRLSRQRPEGVHLAHGALGSHAAARAHDAARAGREADGRHVGASRRPARGGRAAASRSSRSSR